MTTLQVIGLILIWLGIGLLTAYYDAPVTTKITKIHGFTTGHRARMIIPIRFLVLTIGGPVGVIVKMMSILVKHRR